MRTLGAVDCCVSTAIHIQRSTPLLELTIMPEELTNILLRNCLAVGRQIDGVDLVVGVDFSKTNYHFLPVSNVVPKC